MPRMGPCVPFAPALLTLSLHITLHIYFISSRLFILLHVICVMVNKAVKKRFHTIDALCAIVSECFVISLKIITGKWSIKVFTYISLFVLFQINFSYYV